MAETDEEGKKTFFPVAAITAELSFFRHEIQLEGFYPARLIGNILVSEKMKLYFIRLCE